MANTEFAVESMSDQSRSIRTGAVLDNSNADRFSSVLMDLYESEMKYIMIDMTSLEFLSSAGIGSILGTVELFRERGGDIVLASVGEKIMHILDVLDLAGYLTICRSASEAAARCGM